MAVEYDGGNHRDRLVDDNRRQNRLIVAGFCILRFTAADVYGSPETVVTQVRHALQGGDTAKSAQKVVYRESDAAKRAYMALSPRGLGRLHGAHQPSQ